MKKLTVRIFSFLLVISTVLALAGCTMIVVDPGDDNKQSDNSTVTTEKKNNVKITVDDIEEGSMLVEVLEIGKADCIIINCGGYTVMIDAGEEDDKSSIFSRIILDKIDKIDYLIISHYDRDHIGCVPDILKTYKVDKLIQSDYTPLEPFNESYTNYLAALETTDAEIINVKDEMNFTLGDMEFEITGPKGRDYSESGIDNNNSLLVGLKHKGNSFMFAGDVEKLRIIDILKDGIGNYDFLKVPHHGVNNSQSKDFINAIKPKYAVICCSDKNPADVVLLEKLRAVNAEIYETENGTVYAISSSSGIEIKQ